LIAVKLSKVILIEQLSELSIDLFKFTCMQVGQVDLNTSFSDCYNRIKISSLTHSQHSNIHYILHKLLSFLTSWLLQLTSQCNC